MILDKPIVQTYVEIRYKETTQYLQISILEQLLAEVRDTLFDEIGVQDDITGRARYSLTGRGTFLKIYIEQYLNTLDRFNANDVIQKIMERLLKLGHETLTLETIVENENLNGEIRVRCPQCSGKGVVSRGYDDADCPKCDGWGETTTNDPTLKIIPLAPKGM